LLLKKEEVIRPQTVSTIKNVINQIQSNFGFWNSEIDKEFYKANKILNKIYPKPDKKLDNKKNETKKRDKEEEKEDKKKPKKFKLQNEPEIKKLLAIYDDWTQLFNTLEQKFTSVIFHQKVLRKEPHNIESKQALYELLKELRLN
jgi:hypothetical protein